MPQLYVKIAQKIFQNFKGARAPPAPRRIRLWLQWTNDRYCLVSLGEIFFVIKVLSLEVKERTDGFTY